MASSETPTSGHKYYRFPTPFEVQKTYRDALGLPPQWPFASEEEWEVAEFMIESGLTQGEMDRLLKTGMVSYHFPAIVPIEALTVCSILIVGRLPRGRTTRSRTGTRSTKSWTAYLGHGRDGI